jgi:hypothetical protein
MNSRHLFQQINYVIEISEIQQVKTNQHDNSESFLRIL